jgi:S-disulfanyl-L-cysteine oxidoreductase SoxD
VKAAACMNNCAAEPQVASFLPDFARNNHGNLAEQQRPVGPQRGADTTRAAGAAITGAVAAPAAPVSPAAPALALAQKYTCTACHGIDNKIVGPGFREIAARHGARADAQAYLAGKIKAGGQGQWGSIPMPPQTLPEADLQALAQWLAAGAKK